MPKSLLCERLTPKLPLLRCESHIVAHLSIWWFFPLRTHEARELRLHKPLMEEAMCPCAHSKMTMTDPPECLVPPSPANAAPTVTAAPSKTRCSHEKHNHGHNCGYPRETATKHSTTSPSRDRLDEMSHVDRVAPPLKKSKVEQSLSIVTHRNTRLHPPHWTHIVFHGWYRVRFKYHARLASYLPSPHQQWTP